MAKPTVVIPVNELNSFDLPPVCVVTGQRENVTFRDVKFSWYPRWIALFVLGALIIAAILAAIMTKRVKGQLPFSEEGWAKWQKRKLVVAGLAVGFFVLLVTVPFIAASSDSAVVVTALSILVLGDLVALIVASATMANVQCTRIADGAITLRIPSESAAAEITQHLHSGARRPVALAPVVAA